MKKRKTSKINPDHDVLAAFISSKTKFDKMKLEIERMKAEADLLREEKRKEKRS